MTDLWIALRLSAPSLSVWRLHWLIEPEIAAVIDNGAVLTCTSGAYAAGVRIGMRRASAIGIAQNCVMLDRDPQAEQALLDTLAQIALRYTPCVVQHVNHTILLDIAGSVNLFGGVRALFNRLNKDINASRLRVATSLAPSAMGAWLLAQPKQPSLRRFLKMSKLHRALDQMTCARIPEALPYLVWLTNIGCHTLGQLRQLPRAGLKRRSSLKLLNELDQIYGQAVFPYQPYVAPEHFQQKIDLMDRAENTAAIQSVVEVMLGNLCIWLAAKQSAILRLKFIFYHERYRQADSSSELILSIAEPAWLVAHLLKLLKEQLAKHSFDSPAVGIELVSVELSALPAGNGLLFADKRRQSAELSRLLDLIAMRIEANNVLSPNLVNDYRPEIANRWNAYRSQKSIKHEASKPETHTDTPFWLLAKPLALSIKQDRPVVGMPLQLIQGPERIESGWWDAPLTARDYFVAQDTQGIRYWLYRERDTDPVRWFLHGLFA
ncbi:protein ImuB [Jezberella montanilacus]|uniref:Protein ImuB n=1 Tax=Jezberella montanilacus TaxID=323426 RepID=A0A2T0XJC0_9BURK|nr:DNA polymerase Y family protein [Jezberella montanilacus]PRY98980.1 protein ImuB [Jezberella montanilacus]